MSKQNPIIIIPARMKAERLPGKPLADIHGKPMIVHVAERATRAGIGPVVVAAAEQEIVDAVTNAGFKAVLTDPDLPSGTDRIFAGWQKIDPDKKHDVVINLQGDLPTMEPEIIKEILPPLQKGADISTLITKARPGEENNPNIVKAVMSYKGRALYFSRGKAPYGEGPFYHHMGIYAYKQEALEKFVTLPQTPLEKRERLEQLRALENDMRIDAVLVNAEPLGVDTSEDLEMARQLLKVKR